MFKPLKQIDDIFLAQILGHKRDRTRVPFLSKKLQGFLHRKDLCHPVEKKTIPHPLMTPEEDIRKPRAVCEVQEIGAFALDLPVRWAMAQISARLLG